MNIAFYYPGSARSWQPNTPDTEGIGCSETAIVEVSRRLAARGHAVRVHTHCEPCEDAGVLWLRCADLGHDWADLWVSHRYPDIASITDHGRAVIWAQDVGVPGLNEHNAARFEAVLVMCAAHERSIAAVHPYVRTVRTSNATRLDLVEQIEAEGPPERSPHRMIFASSPDRGLANLLDIYPRVLEQVPDAELDIYYGFDGFLRAGQASTEDMRAADGVFETQPALFSNPAIARLYNMVHACSKRWPGLHYHGRVGQRELYEAWLSSALWVHPSNFTETSCETCMAAQACGAIPITRPLWATADNVHHGVLIDGDCTNPLIRQEYVAWAVQIMRNPERAEAIRSEMMPAARERFSWDAVVDQWERDILPQPPEGSQPLGGSPCATANVPEDRMLARVRYQRRWCAGAKRILNVAAHDDPAHLAVDFGAVNLDILDMPGIDVVADIRTWDTTGVEPFDLIVVGDLLEHCMPGAQSEVLIACAALLAECGRICITCPEDPRALTVNADAPGIAGQEDISSHHQTYVTQHDLFALLDWLGLVVADYEYVASELGCMEHHVTCAPAQGEQA